MAGTRPGNRAGARRAGVPVLYTAQKGNQFRPDRGLQADLWGPGMSATPEHEEILPDLGLADAGVFLSSFDRRNISYAVAEKHQTKQQLRRFIRQEHAGHSGSGTISIGVACANNESTVDDLLEAADAALYRAKNEGRNRVCLADEGKEEQ